MKTTSKKHLVAFVFFLATVISSFAQDSLMNLEVGPLPHAGPNYSMITSRLVIPALFIGYGIGSLTSAPLRDLNLSTRAEIKEHRPTPIRLDNYTQYMPALMVYGLNAAGIKGRHNFRDRTIILASSQLISAAFVVPLKHQVKEPRPDGSNTQSFPSGHTATAFSTAHFMFREYKDTNFWLSISAYPFAAFTGVYRTLNNKHWVGDVAAGAGIGILSTELSYWLFPRINALFPGGKRNGATIITPVYQHRSIGLGIVRNL